VRTANNAPTANAVATTRIKIATSRPNSGTRHIQRPPGIRS
jgi:hypothetical protein